VDHTVYRVTDASLLLSLISDPGMLWSLVAKTPHRKTKSETYS